ncbi:MAG: insulinase family protein [Parcubacteria group bacterium]|nr:insulinase family protein [Parcubacteria group bacterium]
MKWVKLKAKCGALIWVYQKWGSKGVASGVLVRAGSRDERWPKQAGIAHAYEHMVFHGTTQFPTSKALSEYIELVGGQWNAWTSQEATFYHTIVPKQYAMRGFVAQSQLVNDLLFPLDKIEIEMRNIVGEMKLSEDNAEDIADRIFEEAIYGAHPLGHYPLGIEEIVLAFSRENFLEYQKQFYYPENFVFVVVGGINPRAAKEMIDESFTVRSTGREPHKPGALKIERPQSRVIFEDHSVEQDYIVFGSLTASADSDDNLSLDVFRAMIDGGTAFPLFQEIRDKKGLTYGVCARLSAWSDGGTFAISMSTDPPRSSEAIMIARDVIEKSKTSEVLLENAKKVLCGEFDLRYESIGRIMYDAAEDISGNGGPIDPGKYKKDIKAVSIEDIERVVDTYLAPDRLITVIVGPERPKEV